MDYKGIIKDYYSALELDLQGDTIPLLEFPLCVFPRQFNALIEDAKEVSCFNPDMLGCAILTAVSTAIGNSRRVVLKKGSHTDSASLFLLLVADQSSNKSRILKFAFSPLMKLQSELEEQHRRKVREYHKEVNAQRFNKKAANTPEPIPPAPMNEIILNDVNIETMFQMYATNEVGMCYLADEFVRTMLYFDKDPSAEADFLELWNTGERNRHRRQYKLTMPNVFLTLTGGTQPVNIHRFGYRDRIFSGFTTRFLFCYPENIKAALWSENLLNPVIYDFYDRMIRSIYVFKPVDFETQKMNVQEYHFSDEAKKLVYFWQHQNAKLMDKCGNSVLNGAYGKFDSYILRFSLILQVLSDFCEENSTSKLIREETVINAIHLIEYFRRNFFKVKREIVDNTPEYLRKLSEKHKALYSQLNDTFTTQEVKTLGKMDNASSSRYINGLISNKIIQKQAHGIYTKLFL